MRALVTGVAGFIGSTLAEALIARGDTVRGIDSFSPYYDPALKRSNVDALQRAGAFQLVEADLIDADADALTEDVDVVFHQAAQPGVRASWADGFGSYVTNNIVATQRLLEAARRVDLDRFVYASSSSVYGNAVNHPTSEDELPRPYSPYGVTKLAAEHLCSAYAANFAIPTVALRYFTVYGPRQRPDMAIGRLLRAGLEDRPFTLFGDGRQLRDFTFAGDVVDANLRAAGAELSPGTVLNVAGGSVVSMIELLELAERAIGRPIKVHTEVVALGDVRETSGSTALAHDQLGWEPKVTLEAGLRAHVDWLREHDAARDSGSG